MFLCTVKYYKYMLYPCLYVVLLTCLKLIQAKIWSVLCILFLFLFNLYVWQWLTATDDDDNSSHTYWYTHTHVQCQQIKETKNGFYIFQLLNWLILPCPALRSFARIYSFHTSWNNKHPYLPYTINLIGLPKTKIATIKPRITKTRNFRRK